MTQEQFENIIDRAAEMITGDNRHRMYSCNALSYAENTKYNPQKGEDSKLVKAYQKMFNSKLLLISPARPFISHHFGNFSHTPEALESRLFAIELFRIRCIETCAYKKF